MAGMRSVEPVDEPSMTAADGDVDVGRRADDLDRPTARSARSARWIRSGLAVMIAGAVAVISVVTAGAAGRAYLIALAGVGLLLFGAGMGTRVSTVIGAAVLCLASVFVLGHLGRDAEAGHVAVVAPLLFAAAELAHWSIDLSSPVYDERGVHLARWIWFLVSVGATVVLSAVLVGAGRIRVEGDLPLASFAVVMVICILVLVAVVASRDRSP